MTSPDFSPAAETVRFAPSLVVLFGATGDLASRKLIPAFFQLMELRGQTDPTHLLGVATSALTDEGFRERVVTALVASGVPTETATNWAAQRVSYQSLSESYEKLAARIASLESAQALPGNRVFYLAIPPPVFDDVVTGLAKAGLNQGPGWVRLVVEKPFGTDLSSSRELNGLLHTYFDERQIYRIDHYLAKETVQNLLVFRFANPLFESSWNRDRVDSVTITVAETLGLEGRAGYFDRAGIIRDIVQNHLFQLLALLAMEPPVRFEAEPIRAEKVKLLQAIYPLLTERAVRGQYRAGRVEGVEVPGYPDEEAIHPGSTTETFAALRVDIDNWRWRGVPFYLRAGKRMPERVTQIVVKFKEPPVNLFDQGGACRVHANVLFISLQPDEGFDLMFDVKTPGEGMELRTWPLSFRYGQAFGILPDAYETLLADILSGDQTLFVRADEAEEAWRILTPMLDLTDPPHPYPAGSWGPAAADQLIHASGDRWIVRDPSSSPDPI